MFRPLSIYIGLRYTRARARNGFISLISFVSMLGIALGVMVLIAVLSVLNGFDKEIKKQIFGMISPITVSTPHLRNWRDLKEGLTTYPNVTAVAPYINGQAMLTNGAITEATMLTGILPAQEKGVSVLAEKMLAGELNQLQAGQFAIVLGETLANKLKVNVGDNVIVATLKNMPTSTRISPHFRTFKVIGLFKAGGLGFDAKMAFIHLNDAQRLFAMSDTITGFHLNIQDIYAAPKMTQTLQNELTPIAQVWNWTEILGEFFENIRVTKTIMFFIFVLIIAVAVFNLICTMVMVVKRKQADIAILRTLGATPCMVLTIFIVQGIAIGLGGILLGIAGGVLLALNMQALSTWIQEALHIELISANVYFVNYLPAELQWVDVGIISMIAFLLSLCATLYPAWNASRIIPVEALRDD